MCFVKILEIFLSCFENLVLACACWRLAGTAEPQLLKASSDGLAFLWFSYSKCSLHDNVCRNEVLIFVIIFQATFPLRSPAFPCCWAAVDLWPVCVNARISESLCVFAQDICNVNKPAFPPWVCPLLQV